MKNLFCLFCLLVLCLMNVLFELDGVCGEDFKNDSARFVLFVVVDLFVVIFCCLCFMCVLMLFKIFVKMLFLMLLLLLLFIKLILLWFDVRFGGGGVNFFINSLLFRCNDFFMMCFLFVMCCVGGYVNLFGLFIFYVCLLLV